MVISFSPGCTHVGVHILNFEIYLDKPDVNSYSFFRKFQIFFRIFSRKYPILWKNPNSQAEEDTSNMPQRYRVEKYLLYCILFDSFVNILLIGRFYFHFEADLDISTGYQIIQKLKTLSKIQKSLLRSKNKPRYKNVLKTFKTLWHLKKLFADHQGHTDQLTQIVEYRKSNRKFMSGPYYVQYPLGPKMTKRLPVK